jgi:hypothetical protein
LVNSIVPDCDNACAFVSGGKCTIPTLRKAIGDHIQQHDAMPAVPPCQCGGKCHQ